MSRLEKTAIILVASLILAAVAVTFKREYDCYRSDVVTSDGRAAVAVLYDNPVCLARACPNGWERLSEPGGSMGVLVRCKLTRQGLSAGTTGANER